jgi:hypothetical protein
MEVKMKIFMTLNKTKILALLGGFLITATVHGQNDQPKDINALREAPLKAQKETPPFSIDFPGGTADALVQEVGKQSGSRPNVIIPEQMEKVLLPRFKLQNVSMAQIFEAMNLIIDERGMQHFRWMNEGPKTDPHTVWILSRIPLRPPAETCQVWSVGHLLEAYPLEEINTAIRATWQMLGQPSNAALKFHPETKLLIARGNEQELKLAQEVLKELQVGMVAKKTNNAKAGQ